MENQASPQTQKRNISSNTILILAGVALFAIIFCGGFGYLYFNGPCGVNHVQASSGLLTDQFQEFSDAYEVAASTSRISLSGPVAELQRIQRETEKIEVPGCMETAKEELVLSMDTSVDGFLAFMSDEADSTVSLYLSESDDHATRFADELIAVDECKPFCSTK